MGVGCAAFPGRGGEWGDEPKKGGTASEPLVPAARGFFVKTWKGGSA